MISNDSYTHTWNARTSQKVNHIAVDRKKLFDHYYQAVAKRIDLTGKIVVDLGCGGGWLGKYLLSNFLVNQYIGLDISERSLNFAKNNLKGRSRADFYLIKPLDKTLPICDTVKVDLMVSLSVIQHLPDKEHLDNLIERINGSKAEKLIIQVRHGHVESFSGSYGTMKNLIFACLTNAESIARRLTNYVLTLSTGYDNDAKYQYLYFEVKR